MIEAVGLHKSFGATHAVRGVSLSVGEGEAFGLVGPDGAGKTTVLRLLVGALGLDAGHVRINGHDIATSAEAARSEMGYLAQRFSVYGDLTVAENVRFFGEVRGVSRADLAARSAELLGFVGLDGFEDRPSGVLSGGMKQKLGLACALIHRPRVVLLDEPTGGLDPLTRQDFWQLISRLTAAGAAVVVSTPYMDEAARCTRLGFMQDGALLREGAPRELAAALGGRVLELAVRETIGHASVTAEHGADEAEGPFGRGPGGPGPLGAEVSPSPTDPQASARSRAAVLAVVRADPEVEDILAFGDRFHLRVRSAAGPLERLPAALSDAGVTVVSLRAVPASLEDAFIALLAGA